MEKPVAELVQVRSSRPALSPRCGSLPPTSRSTGWPAASARCPARRPSGRSLGGADRALRSIHLVVPAVGLAVWWTCTLPAGAVHAPIPTAIFALGVLAAVYRTATRKPILYDGGLAHTPLGPVPANLLVQVLRGPDLVSRSGSRRRRRALG